MVALFPPGIPFIKRLADLVFALVLFVLLAPLMGAIALLIWALDGRPALFSQARSGYRGRPFFLYKFRTMTTATDAKGILLPDEQRLPRWGRLLRASSLDELPGLLNVLRGEMSMVGPRPLFAHYLERYSCEQRRRLDVLPGITGWAQINGRNALSWEEKFALDVWYVDHWSVGLDLKILLLTVWKVLKRDGISQPGQATAEEFMGTSITGGGHPTGG